MTARRTWTLKVSAAVLALLSALVVLYASTLRVPRQPVSACVESFVPTGNRTMTECSTGLVKYEANLTAWTKAVEWKAWVPATCYDMALSLLVMAALLMLVPLAARIPKWRLTGFAVIPAAAAGALLTFVGPIMLAAAVYLQYTPTGVEAFHLVIGDAALVGLSLVCGGVLLLRLRSGLKTALKGSSLVGCFVFVAHGLLILATDTIEMPDHVTFQALWNINGVWLLNNWDLLLVPLALSVMLLYPRLAVQKR